MKRFLAFIFLFSLVAFRLAVPLPNSEPLHTPLSNNAVAEVKTRGSLLLYSFMGIGPKKTWDAISSAGYYLDIDTGKWSLTHPVPGTAGRIAAVAAGARDHIFLFGGYAVDAQGGEITVPEVNVYESLRDLWFRGADIPVAVDDSVAGVYHERFLYLVSEWPKPQAGRDVQILGPQNNKR